MFRIIKHAISLVIMTLCSTQVSACDSNDNITSISAYEFEKEVRTDSVQLLDVRTPQEYAEGHIAGAVNIDVQSDDFQQMVKNELSKDSTILVYCRSGRRSMDAAERLTRLGYKVINLKGGIVEWEDCSFPVTTKEPHK